MPGLLLPCLPQQFLPVRLSILRNKGLLVGHEFFHPCTAFGSRIRQINDDPRSVGLFQQLQTSSQDVALVFRVMRSTRRVAQGIVEKNLSRVASTGGDIPRVGVGDGGDVSRLQNSGNQTHGLMADGSDGRQQCHVHVVLPALPEDFRSVYLRCLLVAVIR